MGGRALCRVTEGWAQLGSILLSLPMRVPLVPLSHCPSLWGGGASCHWRAVPGSCAVSVELTLFSLLTVGSGLRQRSRTRQFCWRTWYVCLSSSSSFCQQESRA